jgi:predicted nucleotidyltransferase component of viral defense system
MITKNQLKALSRRSGINPYYQEKDYLLNVFLYSLYKTSRDFVFKGGTCLKVVYNQQRFSEDLDFNTTLRPDRVGDLVRRALKGFSLLGMDYEVQREELFEASYTSRWGFRGPLYSEGSPLNCIQVDAGLRDKLLLKPSWRMVVSPYPDIPDYLVLAMQEGEILAEKIRALYERGKPRDLFDVWVMFSKGVVVDGDILHRKLGGKIRLKLCTEREFKRDLANLLPTVPSYDQVSRDVRDKLSGLIKRA